MAARLGLPFYVVDVADAFAAVLADFESAYLAGRTPNPCILCNRWVKFGRLLEIARGLGATRVATGHYARVVPGRGGRTELWRARDARKDQSYVLATLTQEQLAAACFPLGQSTKAEVRAEAEALGLGVARKPDSQELCFVPARGGHRAWLRERRPTAFRPGVFEDAAGRALGRHDGAAGFTPGQRRGLPALGTPRHVAKVDVAAGRVTLVARADLEHRWLLAREPHWVSEAPWPCGATGPVEVRIRHAGAPQRATLTVLAGPALRLDFAQPAFAPAPGQTVVAYAGDRVLVSATIQDSGA